MIKISLFILIMIIAIGIHYYIFYYKPTHTNVSETLSNMCMVPSTTKKLDDIPKLEISIDTNKPESKNVIENTTDNQDRPKIQLDVTHKTNKTNTNNVEQKSNNEIISNVQPLTVCTYTPSNDFVYQNDGPGEPSGSNQTMDYMSSKFVNDNLYQASFFTFSPSKNRIVYTDRPNHAQLI